ncbi:rod shape-determining protein MreC [Nitratifractor sp.]
MRARILLLLLLSLLLFILVNRNNQELRFLVLDLINPLKSNYKEVSREIQDKGESYLFQKERIEKLSRENRVLRKYLLDQTHYLRQVASLYKKLPTLERLPYKSVALVDTISYVKLNKFDEVLLTIPKKIPLKEGKIYGLIQDEVVAGIARYSGGLLDGILLSNPKCRFDVFIGPKRYPGIAEGVDKNLIAVKFIPKWAKIKKGDRVETSGLDGIFFANIPVGVVQKTLVEGSYQTAYVRTYADTMHPGIFFLITDASPYLVSFYDQNRSFPDSAYPYAHLTPRKREENLSSVPKVLQTKELEINPSEFEIPIEEEKSPINTSRKERHPSKKKKKIDSKKPQTVTPLLPSEKKGMPSSEEKKASENEKKKSHPSPFDILKSGLF